MAIKDKAAEYPIHALSPSATVTEALMLHWREYLMEAAELAAFMFAACVFGTLLFYTKSPVVRDVPNTASRLVLMGLAMGTTAVSIIRSPLGLRTGAHFNPAVSFTFFCLSKMHRLDLLFYVVSQFMGGAFGVLLAHLLLGARLADPSVRYVVTVPGHYGLPASFLAEFFMGFLMITVVLHVNSSPLLSRYTWLFVGFLVSFYVIAFSFVSGFSLNPARTLSSALFAGIWTAMWLYFSAPLLGMLSAAALFVLTSGTEAVYCGKVYHDLESPCPFPCRFRELLLSNPAVSSR